MPELELPLPLKLLLEGYLQRRQEQGAQGQEQFQFQHQAVEAKQECSPLPTNSPQNFAFIGYIGQEGYQVL